MSYAQKKVKVWLFKEKVKVVPHQNFHLLLTTAGRKLSNAMPCFPLTLCPKCTFWSQWIPLAAYPKHPVFEFYSYNTSGRILPTGSATKNTLKEFSKNTRMYNILYNVQYTSHCQCVESPDTLPCLLNTNTHPQMLSRQWWKAAFFIETQNKTTLTNGRHWQGSIASMTSPSRCYVGWGIKKDSW